MVVWIALAAAIGTLALTVRTWLDFARRAQRLGAEIEHARRQIEDHSASLAMDRAKIEEVKQETNGLLAERDRAERDVLEKRGVLTQLEERLERTRPKSHRVDTDGKGGDLF